MAVSAVLARLRRFSGGTLHFVKDNKKYPALRAKPADIDQLGKVIQRRTERLHA